MTTTSSTTTTTPPPDAYRFELSHWCRVTSRAALYVGALRDIIRRQFASPENIEDPILKHLIWQKDRSTRILVEVDYRWKPESTGQTPAIILRRNSYRPLDIAIAQRGSSNAEAQRRGIRHQVGSVTIFCISGDGLMADLIANEVDRYLTEFGAQIRTALLLHSIRVTEVGGVSILEEQKQNFVVPVSVGYQFEHAWLTLQHRPKWKGFDSSLSCLIG